jgi:imidazolonepropionase-like amidohydrolase
VDYIKLYAGFLPRQVAVAVAEAHRHGRKVIGHLQGTSWTEGAEAGIDFITHAGNWHPAYVRAARRDAYNSLPPDMRARSWWLEWLDVNGAAVDSMARTLAGNSVSVDPTLVAYHTKFWWRDSIYQRDPDTALVPEVLNNWRVLGMHTRDWSKNDFDRAQRAWPNLLALVRKLSAVGILLTIGSDVASPWVIPGTGFHQELALLVSAGFSPGEVLTMATRNGALALGIADSVGTIQEGKIADLVVLSENPLADIRNSRSIEWVFRRGIQLDPERLLAR